MTSNSGDNLSGRTFMPMGDISTRAAWRYAVIGSLTSAVVLWIFVSVIFRQIDAGDTATLWIDFNPLWTAAFLANEGRPLDAFDADIFQALQGTADRQNLPWLYPPGMMLLLSPLGALPFKWAWVTMMGVSLAASFAAIWALTGGRILLVLGFGLALGSLVTLFVGQTSILWVAGLLGALVALRHDRFVLAGVLIGLLTLKPQLGVLIPFALVAAGHWRTFWVATITTIAVLVVPTLLYGIEYWPLLIDAHFAQSAQTSVDAEHNIRMVTMHSVVAGLGATEEVALAIQGILFIVAASFVWRCWRDAGVSWALKAAGLMCATAIALPYFWYYDTVILIPAGLLLVYAGRLAGTLGALLLVILWTGAGPLMLGSVIATAVTEEAVYMPIRYYLLPVCLGAFLVCFRALREHQTKPAI